VIPATEIDCLVENFKNLRTEYLRFFPLERANRGPRRGYTYPLTLERKVRPSMKPERTFLYKGRQTNSQPGMLTSPLHFVMHHPMMVVHAVVMVPSRRHFLVFHGVQFFIHHCV
jgi:hypothetical protein